MTRKKNPRRWVAAAVGDAPDPMPMRRNMSKRSSTAKKQHKWIQVSSSLAPDPRVSDKSQTQRFVLVTTLIDQDGQVWEKVGRDEPVLIGRPPA